MATARSRETRTVPITRTAPVPPAMRARVLPAVSCTTGRVFTEAGTMATEG